MTRWPPRAVCYPTSGCCTRPDEAKETHWPELRAPEGEMIWCDGFEIETVISCRVIAAGLKIAEVPSVERSRVHGESNLRTFADGYRVLRTLLSERRRATGLARRRTTQA